ncbi:MAG: hypothetical protein KatS3mg105_5285 [Gemmatales bacterium]|nr:MAG: hypothetical protein KatS3mg105_5285 [Gemmatales bacterium]
MQFRKALRIGLLYEPLIADVVCNDLWPGSIPIRWPAKAVIDFAVVKDGEIIALLEVKKRFVTSTKYKTTIFQTNKADIANAVAAYLKVPVLAAVLFNDTLRLFDLRNTGNRVMITATGRNVAVAHYEYEINQAVKRDDLAAKIVERLNNAGNKSNAA